MKRSLRRRLLVASLVWPLAAAAQDPLPPPVKAALDAAGVPEDAFAAMLLPLGRAARPWRHRADAPMQPASTMKLVTSVVALDRLGPEHRGFTELLVAGPVDGGVLRGDLVLRGGGDPELGVPQLWALLMELREQGVHTVAGDLLLDRTRYRPARTDLGAPPFDEAPEFPYNVIPDALHLAGSLLPLEIGADGERVTARSVPALPDLEVTSAMAPTDRRCADWDDDWQPARVRSDGRRLVIELRGGFPRHCTQRTALQLVDRDQLAERLVRTLWAGLGGRWLGQAREAAAPAVSRVVARHDARPWGEVLRHLNKRSDNPQARLLFAELGVPAQPGAPADARTLDLAAREVERWFDEHGIDRSGLVLDNGSGLSRRERLTPRQLARLLQAAWHGRWASELVTSLVVAGVDTPRLRDSPAAGRARLKGGTLRDVASLAGIVHDADGRPWALAAMVNHPHARLARPALDALVDFWARGRRADLARPSAGPLGEGP